MSAFFASIHELFIGAIVHANEKKMGRRLRQFYVVLDILFSSNHNIHKSSSGHFCLTSDPLIEGF